MARLGRATVLSDMRGPHVTQLRPLQVLERVAAETQEVQERGQPETFARPGRWRRRWRWEPGAGLPGVETWGLIWWALALETGRRRTPIAAGRSGIPSQSPGGDRNTALTADLEDLFLGWHFCDVLHLTSCFLYASNTLKFQYLADSDLNNQSHGGFPMDLKTKKKPWREGHYFLLVGAPKVSWNGIMPKLQSHCAEALNDPWSCSWPQITKISTAHVCIIYICNYIRSTGHKQKTIICIYVCMYAWHMLYNTLDI